MAFVGRNVAFSINQRKRGAWTFAHVWAGILISQKGLDMSRKKFVNIDLSRSTEFIAVKDLDYGANLFSVSTKLNEWCVELDKDALGTRARVWRAVRSRNGQYHSRYDRDTDMHSAYLGNSARLHGYFFDDFYKYAEAQKYVRAYSHAAGIDICEF